jgi:AcrR family transcriptional regulator
MAEGYVQHQKKQADKIIRITEKLYMERGMEGFTIGDIADGAEITRATVYNYFSCKRTSYGPSSSRRWMVFCSV